MKNFSLLSLMLVAMLAWTSCEKEVAEPSGETTQITLFQFTSPFAAVGIVDNTAKTVKIPVPFGSDVSAVTGSVAVTTGATVTPDLSSPVNFSAGPVTFTVTNGKATSTYTATIEEGENPVRLVLVGDAAKVEDLNDEVKTAYEWALDEYASKAQYIPFNELTADKISPAKAIWFHLEEVDRLLPATATGAALDVIENWYKAGGNLLLTKHATQYLVNLGRLPADWAPTDGGSNPAPFDNPDDWGQSFKLNTEFAAGNEDHPMFKNLTPKSVTFDGITYDAYMYIDGGSKRDNAYFWFVYAIPGMKAQFDTDGDGVISEAERDTNGDGIFTNGVDSHNQFKDYFEAQTKSTVRGAFEWDPVFAGAEFYTTVEFNADGAYQGKAMALGFGAYEWFQNDGRVNDWRGNIEGVTANIFEYFGVE